MTSGVRLLFFDMLKSVTEYEGCDEDDEHCVWFFEVLREMTTVEKEVSEGGGSTKIELN